MVHKRVSFAIGMSGGTCLLLWDSFQNPLSRIRGEKRTVAMSLVGNSARESQFMVDLKSPSIEFDRFLDIPSIPGKFKCK
jgi:hypothetical protein